MSQELGPLAACLDELRTHLENGVSGSFCLTLVDNSVATIALASGIIETVDFQGRHGDFAFELLKGIKSASCTFRSEPPRTVKESRLSKRAIRWLTGADEKSAASVRRTAPGGLVADRHRRAIETISFSFLGPIAGVICDSAFARSGDLKQVVDELAGNLAPAEAENFRNAVAKAVDHAPIDGAAGGKDDIDRHRQLIEEISFAFLGPIAGVVCKAAFAECGELKQLIDEIAGKLPPDEAANFRKELAKAIDAQ